MDSLSNKVIYHQFVSTKKDEYYQLALNRFRNKNYVIQSVTCDGRRGLLKDLLDTPTQMSHFHLVAMVMRKLGKKHKGLRGAYASLKYDEKYLFTFEKYSELNIEKTTNRLEGLFSELKRKLINHNGLTKIVRLCLLRTF